MRLLPTPTLKHKLFGVNLYNKKKSEVFLCEGVFDAMALWETLRTTKRNDKGELISTANPNSSLLYEANVLAVPGCKVFFVDWIPLFSGKTVNLVFDNDHPRENPKTGKDIEPAGLSGMQRIAAILNADKKPPLVINYLQWGEHGYDLDLPSGYDVRDHLTKQE